MDEANARAERGIESCRTLPDNARRYSPLLTKSRSDHAVDGGERGDALNEI